MDTVPGEAASGSWAAATAFAMYSHHTVLQTLARLAQSVERKALNLVVVDSKPHNGCLIVGSCLFCLIGLREETLSFRHLWQPGKEQRKGSQDRTQNRGNRKSKKEGSHIQDRTQIQETRKAKGMGGPTQA